MNISIEVTGTSPLLLHNPAGMQLPSTELKRGKNIPTPENEAEAGTYRLPDGQLAIPSFAFRGCVASAAKGVKIGKSFATTLVKGAVFVSTELTPLRLPNGKPAHDYVIDARRARVGNAGITRHRPKLEQWSASVLFDIEADLISKEQVMELLSMGGRTVGVGDFRPEKSGPFGRFTVQ